MAEEKNYGPSQVPLRPIPESYWVITGSLLAGEYPVTWDNTEFAHHWPDVFLESGFTTFIDLTGLTETLDYSSLLQERSAYYGVTAMHFRFPIGDFGLPSPELMTEILNTIDLALIQGQKVYLHCYGGIGRTGTTVGCFLVRHGLTGQQALEKLANWWQAVPKSTYHPRSPETSQQVEFILHWSENG